MPGGTNSKKGTAAPAVRAGAKASRASKAVVVWGDDVPVSLVDLELDALLLRARCALQEDDPELQLAARAALRREVELLVGARLAKAGGAKGGAPKKKDRAAGQVHDKTVKRDAKKERGGT